MFGKNRIRVLGRSILLGCLLGLIFPLQSRSQSGSPGLTLGSPTWESKARLHRRLKSEPGELVLMEGGVEFRPAKGPTLHWPFVEIKTIDVRAPNRLSLTSYENRGRHFPGDREFRFEISTPMPSSVAMQLIAQIGKPAINGVPEPQGLSLATIPARHRTRTGGSNGELHFRSTGIDYLTSGTSDSRGWRWTDIETLANPDPFHFRVGGYLETFEFELKQPMSAELFHRLWDEVYGRDLNVGAGSAKDFDRSYGFVQNGGEQGR